MTRYFLSRLQIEDFAALTTKGNRDLKLDVDAVNSVFGPNGREELHFRSPALPIYGTVPKLDDLPASERAGAYYSNRFHSSGTSTIILTLAPDDGSPHAQIRIVRDKSGVRSVDSPSGHLDPDKLLRDLRCDSMLLDHSRFAHFVDDTPLARGRSFASLLGLAHISEFRQLLQVLSNKGNLDNDFKISTITDLASTARAQALQALAALRTRCKALLAIDITEPIAPATVKRCVLT